MLSLINFEIQANLGQYEAAMDRAAVVADTSMNRAGAAADRWQAQMDQAAAAAGASADGVAAHFDAAGTAIARSADGSVGAIQRVDQKVQSIDMRSWSEKVSGAFGAGFGAGFVVAESWLDKLEQFVKAKLIITAVAIATGVAAAAIGAVYGAYKASEFVVGLFTGESYKSDSIDSLIKTNDEVMKLQDALGMAAPKAQALLEALAGIGMTQTAYVDVADKTQSAIRTNTEELDRLGVKYKDADGNLLPLIETQRNALAVIDSYTAGWDRNQAAASIGMGTQKELRDAVSITSEEIATAQGRLEEYNLVIGERSQEAVSEYEKAMRAFQRETSLTSDGVKRAIADQIMPLFTDLATFLRDGFPFAVRAFRYSMATLTTLFYGLKEAAYLTGEAVIQSFGAMGDIVTRVATALGQAVSGNFRAAVDTLMAAPNDLGARWSAFLNNAAAQSRHNIEAVKLAWGTDNLTAAEQTKAYESEQANKRKWVAKPDAPEKANGPITVRLEEDPAKALLETQLKTYERAIQEEATLLSNREAMLKGYFDRGSISAEEYYQRLDDVRTEALENTRGDYEAEIALINTYASQQEQGSKRAIEAAGKLSEAQDKLARAGQANAFTGVRTWLDQDSRTALAGFDRFMGSMVESASNTGRLVEGAFTNAFSAMEDAFVSFAKTGKLDFKSMADSIISDIIRIQVRQQMAGLVKMGLSAVGNLFSPAAAPAATTTAAVASYDVGTDYVPYDMLAKIHKGEEIVPADQNRGWTGGKGAPQSVRVELVNQTSQPSQAASATPRFDANGMVVSVILRDLKNNGPIRQALGT
jgi:peptidoglycan hydrolase-like protein with peptidoglycan-binding domain